MRPSGNPRDALGIPVSPGSPLVQGQENCPTTNILHLNKRDISIRRFFGSSTLSSCQSDSCSCINRAIMLKLVCSVSLGFRCLAPEMCRLLTCLGGFPFFLVVCDLRTFSDSQGKLWRPSLPSLPSGQFLAEAPKTVSNVRSDHQFLDDPFLCYPCSAGIFQKCFH